MFIYTSNYDGLLMKAYTQMFGTWYIFNICLPYSQSQGVEYDAIIGVCLTLTSPWDVSSSGEKSHGIPVERNLTTSWSLTEKKKDMSAAIRVLKLGEKNAKEKEAVQHALWNRWATEWTEVGYLKWVWTEWLSCMLEKAMGQGSEEPMPF